MIKKHGGFRRNAGRKKIPDSQKRKGFHVGANPEELAEIKKRAKESGMVLSKYARLKCLED